MNEVDRLYREHADATGFAGAYVKHVKGVLTGLDPAAVAAFIDALLEARAHGRRIFFIGNGGSAATASHFANDIALGTKTSRKPFRATSLTDNAAMLTSIANDYGYEEVFVRQLKTEMTPGDVVVAISASGNSPNVIRAVDYANAHGGVTVGLTGFDGGKLKVISRIVVHLPTGIGEYGPVEDAHMVVDHLVGAFLMNQCRIEQEGER